MILTRFINRSIRLHQFTSIRSITSRSLRSSYSGRPSKFRRSALEQNVPQEQAASGSQVAPPSYFENSTSPPKTIDELKSNYNDSILNNSSAPASSQVSSNISTANGDSFAAGLGTGSSFGSRNNSDSSFIAHGNSFIASIAVIICSLLLLALALQQQEEIARLQKESSSTHVTLHKVLINYKKQMEQQTNKNLVLQKQIVLQNELVKWKLLMHVAMLRKELEDLGYDDKVSIDQVLKEFEKNVKLNNKQNKIWCKDESELKKYLPDINDYDRKS